jgi:fatty acid desaturase
MKLPLRCLALLVFTTASSLCSAYTQPQQPRRARWTRPKNAAASLTVQQAVAIPVTGDLNVQQKQQGGVGGSLPRHDEWIAKLDYDAFGKDVSALGKELQKLGGAEDVAHLNKIVRWRNAAAIIGLATMWTTPNPLTIAALSTWTYASWTMIAHHTCHGGYNRVEAGRFNSRGFALGSIRKRALDWLDWMAPEAWNVEHNRLHHYRLNEVSDPDLVQRNLGFIRDAPTPTVLKYVYIMAVLPIWKWFYYAPNTFKELQISKWKQEGRALPTDFDPNLSATVLTMLAPGQAGDALRQVCRPKEFFAKVLGPFFTARLLLLPLPLLAIPGVGPTLFRHAVVNLVAAEFLTNIHSFITIVTNHAGDDLYTFDDAVKPKSPSFYVRQIVGSANYAYGNDVLDFSHGFLNYQIEHHVWPDLSMRQYQLAAPQLKALCESHGVPYVQESVWERLRKTVDIMVGKATMRVFPTRYEPVQDKAGASGVTWASTNGAIDE